jgi:hypothetical protein
MRLLERQARLLDHLTSSPAIFGGHENATLDPALQGMDPRLLRLEACFSYEKRMEKIFAVFPKTCRLLGAERAAVVREFVKERPPTDISRIENGRQFYDLLRARWRREPPRPPYLEDVAACEFAIAATRVGSSSAQEVPTKGERPRRNIVRRHPDVALLRCAYDIRPVVEGDAEEAAVIRRDTPLAIAVPPGAQHPGAFEVPPAAFDLLSLLEEWTDRNELGAGSEVDSLVSELAQHGLVEVRG